MLEVTIILSVWLGKYLDAYIVAALLLLNSALGFYQEQKASSAVDALKKRLQVTARTIRDGAWRTLPSRNLVPGDIVRLRQGDFVPADVTLLSGRLDVDQSALTGESAIIERKTDEALYSGSIVKRGEANAVVSATGLHTYYGKTTELVQVARPRFHMEDVVSKVVRWLLLIVAVTLSAALVLTVFRGFDAAAVLPLVLVLLVTAIPVALPAMFTISMALGSIELTKKGVLITRLSASEDAATMDILCADKTGTITMNQLSLTNVITLGDFSEEDVIRYGALASQEANQDPIDLAFIASAKQRQLIEEGSPQKEFVPFDPKTRRTEATIQEDHKQFRIMKGAVASVAKACGLQSKEIDQLEAKMQDFAQKGYRTIAVATTKGTSKYELAGLAALYDTPRPDSRKLIEELRKIGVSVKMLTGDALPIAKEIAQDIGLSPNIITTEDLKHSMKEDATEAALAAEKTDGFAEIYPEDKYTIVKSLQATRHVVGMTGDGVNDAPALKQSEVGVAVSNATDVAKGAASVVLTKEGLSSIVDLVQTGRMIYERIVTWIVNKIIKSFAVIIFVSLAYIATSRYIVSAFDIVLLLFLTDFVTLSLSTDNVRWSRKPDTWNVTGLAKAAITLGAIIVVESFGLLSLGDAYYGVLSDLEMLHTFAFEALFFFSVFTLLSVRERSHFWKSKPSKALLSIILVDMLVVAAICTFGIPNIIPIPFTATLMIIAYTLVISLLGNDVAKTALIRRFVTAK